jgi:hypothetical protein
MPTGHAILTSFLIKSPVGGKESGKEILNSVDWRKYFGWSNLRVPVNVLSFLALPVPRQKIPFP